MFDLPQPFGTDDRGDSREDAHVGAIREGLEAEQRDALEPHDLSKTDSTAAVVRPREKYQRWTLRPVEDPTG